ncbi:hypothetical protein [Chryseolinea sp. H1M3-3]|uniref:hypothetical protein n=1 Tax=Chryseolinea sp. H1M3-3 TaxID=3034144 RepID=UPI0023EC35E8|nr:hypothetical protein [Chryseolinea sp. H1M3-3]
MSPKRIIIFFVALEFAIVLIVFFTEGYSLTALQTTTRFSGRLSLFLFSAIFLLYNKPATIIPWLSSKFYLLFTIVHGIHLIELFLFVYLSKIQLIPYRIAGGFLAYAYIFAMPILQWYQATGKISKRTFLILEHIFVYYIWLIFFLTYLPRVQGNMPQAGGSYLENVALLGWVSTLLGMKLSGLIQFQKKKTG